MELKGKYTEAKVFTDIVEGDALSTIYGLLEHPAFEGIKIRIMPDCHQGKDIVVGFTATLGEYVNPSHIGTDIGCSITSVFYNGRVDSEKYAILEHRVKEAIPIGFSINKKKQFTDKEFYKFLNSKMSSARSSWPDMVERVEVSEKYISTMLKRIGMDEGVFYKSLGSLGQGNHFLEMGEDPNGNAVWTIHTGSRNFGQKVFKYWDTVSKRPSSKKTDKRNLIGYLSRDEMKGYLTDLFFCQAYAAWNHEIIKRKISDIMKGFNCKEVDIIQSVHNYINPHDHIIRKGSISANEGELMIIPFNMRDGLAICRGKGNEDWNNSGPHGAGRLMSRSEAKKSIDLDEYQQSMKGIYTTSVSLSTIDESPMAYKKVEDIIENIEPTCEILYMIKPKINIKAGEETYNG